MRELGQGSNEAANDINPLSDSLNDVADAADQLGGGGGALGQVGSAIELVKNPAVLAAGAIVGLIAAFGNVNHEYTNTIALLTELSGSQEKANQTMEYARIVADELGTGINETALAYQQIESAMSRTGAGTNDTRALFESLANAMLRTGKTMEDVADGAVEMLNEGMIEGTVNGEAMQEMLGAGLAPALDGMARAAGVTVEEMGMMLNEGIAINEFLPLLQQGLENAFPLSPIEGFDTAIQRVKNNITTLITDKDMGVMDLFTGLIDKLADGIELTSKELETSQAIFSQWFTVFDAWSNVFKEGWDATQNKVKESNERLLSDIEAIEYKYSDAGKAAAKRVEEELEGAKRTSIALREKAKEIDDLITGYDRLGSKSDAVFTIMSNMLKDVDFSDPKAALEEIDKVIASILEKSPELEEAIGDGLVQAFSQLSKIELANMLEQVNQQIERLPLNIAESAGLIEKQNALIEASAIKVEEQYQKLGINSAASIKQAANEMGIAYGEIKRLGLESSKALDTAFLNLAKSEIAAANAAGQSIPEYLKIEAASRGLSRALNRLIEDHKTLSPELEALKDNAEEVKDAFLDNIDAFDAETESKRDSIQQSIRLAEAKGEEAKAARLSLNLAEYELERNKQRIRLNNDLIETLDIQINAIFAAAQMDGEYSKAEQEVVSNLINTINAIKAKNLALQNQIPIQENQIQQTKNNIAVSVEESDKNRKNSESTKENTEETDKNTEGKKGASSAGKSLIAVLAGQISYWMQTTQALSEATNALFQFKAGFSSLPDVPEGLGVSEEAKKASNQINELGRYISYVQSLWTTSSGAFSDYVNKIEIAGSSAKKAYYEQKLEAERLIASNNKMAETGVHGLASMSAAMGSLNNMSKYTAQSFNLLNEEDLGSLQSSIDKATEKLKDMQKEADDARTAIAELNAEILEERGDTAASEELRLQIEQQERLKEVTESLEKSKLENNRELITLYEEQTRKIDELYNLKKRNLLEEEKLNQEKIREETSSKKTPGIQGFDNNSNGLSGTKHILQFQSPEGLSATTYAADEQSVNQIMDILKNSGMRLAQ